MEQVWASSLKTTGEAFTEKSLDLRNNTIVTKTVEPAKDGELEGTIKVMGGEDWMDLDGHTSRRRCAF